MDSERMAELKKRHKDRNLIEELRWGMHADHSGYQRKSQGEFINWLCDMAYHQIKEQTDRKTGEWINVSSWRYRTWKCSECEYIVNLRDGGIYNYCSSCGAIMDGGKQDDYN